MLPAPEPEKIAARIIERCDRDHPADGLLRAALKEQSGLSRANSREIAGTVFSYFRWLGWLAPEDRPEKRIEQARVLARRFAEDPASFTDADLAARAVPDWIHKFVEVSPAWLRTLQKEPGLWLRARSGQAGLLARKLRSCAPGSGVKIEDAVLYQGKEDLFRAPEFQAGEFEVQDIGSQAVGWLAAPHPGETWWDACAGEGGKTLHLADLMSNSGLIWATDRAEWRLKILKRRAARAKVFNYREALWDGSAKLPTKTKFDGILVDAPCSGTGTWQRNPQARWTTTPEDVKELAQIQGRLLDHVVAGLKPGGKLIYSVCTLAQPETAGVVRFLEERHPELTPLPLSSPFQGDDSLEAQHLFLPQQTDGNGMFVAAWQRQP